MKIVFVIAVLGLILSAIAHFSTFLGVNPEKSFPQVWILHILIFVVWIPAVFAYKDNGQKDFWKTIAGRVPGWMVKMAAVLFAYAIFNFFFTIFALQKGGVPSEIEGKKVLHSHGKIIHTLTNKEYEKHKAYSVRAFSGHWMIFYALGMIILYSKIREDSNPAFAAIKSE
jgi:hypothetical protein